MHKILPILEPYDYARIENSCVYEFNSKSIQSGTFMSPTYPGTYPNVLNCSYKFIGQPNERIYFSFEDISLHYGADQYVIFINIFIINWDSKKISQLNTQTQKSVS